MMQKNINNWFNTVSDRSKSDSEKWGNYPEDVLPMWVADADYASPKSITEAIKTRLDHGVFGYGLTCESLKLLIVDHVKKHFNWEIKPEWIAFKPGVVGSLNTCRAIMGVIGSKAITAVPVYPHLRIPSPVLERPMQLFGMKNEQTENGMRYTPDFEALEESITKETKMLILCNPHNPVGTVYTKQELNRFAEIALKHNLLICSDDIHADFALYEDKPYHPIAKLSEAVAQRSITLMAASKTFNIAGLNCSYAIIPNEKIKKQFETQTKGLSGEVNILGFVASEAAFLDDSGWYNAQKVHLRQQAEYCFEKINQIDGLSMNKMEATYLAWIDATAIQQKLKEKGFSSAYDYLLTHKVAVSPGSNFGCNDFFRINLATSKSLLEKGLHRIQSAISTL